MQHSNPLLLIVEDDISTRYVLARVLKDQGWSIVAVPTLAEGIHRLQEEPACIIVDLQLSDGTGEALLRQIRDAGLISRVVVCTAVRDTGRLEELGTYAPDAVIHKPVDLRELLEACHA